MNIDSIKKMKSGKYKITLDGETFTTYDDVLIKNGILYKKKIDAETFEKMLDDHQYYDAYNKTMSYIMKRQRCTEEVKRYLDKFPLSDDDKKNILKHLKDIGLINDKNYIKSYISDSIYLGTDGPYKIKNQLIELGMDEDDIDLELSKIDSDIIMDKAIKIISKKVKSNTKYSEYQLKQKILYDMSEKGYSKELIISILDNYSFNDSILLEKEYDKQYSKLSKKYSGNELNYKIKQKLYSKGFDINQINEFMQKKEALCQIVGVTQINDKEI